MNENTADLGRRAFVKTTAAAVATPILVPSVLGAPAVHAAGSDIIKIGLVGCGGRGTGATINALNADHNVTLWAMGDTFEDRLNGSLKQIQSVVAERSDRLASEIVQVPPERQFLGFDAYKHVIDAVDVVLLVTTPHFRPQHIRAAVEAGKHIFAEKPLAIDAPGIRSVLESCEMARKKNLGVMSGFCWRHSDPTVAAFKQIHDGAIGQIRAAYTVYNTGPVWVHPRKPEWTDMEYQMRNWYYYTWLGGDHIVEQAVHSIDKLAWAMKSVPPTRAVAVGGRQCRPDPYTGHIYDHFGVTYDYADGARGFHMCRQLPDCPSDNSDYIMGSKGTCSINSWNPRQIFIEGENPWRCKAKRNDMYQREHEEMFAAIRAGTPINDSPWMCTSVLMAIMGRMAAYTGQVVTWEMAMNSKERLGPETYDWNMPLPEPPVAKPGQTKFF